MLRTQQPRTITHVGVSHLCVWSLRHANHDYKQLAHDNKAEAACDLRRSTARKAVVGDHPQNEGGEP